MVGSVPMKFGASKRWWSSIKQMIVGYRVSEDYQFVAIEAPEALAGRQTLYLLGWWDDRFFRVDRYPDDIWHLSGADVARTFAVQVPLDPDTVETLRALARSYSSVTFETPDGLRLQLYGLGERVALSQGDGERLGALGAILAGLIP